MMKSTLRWVDGKCFMAETGSGHTVVMDGEPDVGGRNLGVRPMELLLAGTAGCSAFDVMEILHSSRQEVVDVRVDIVGERAETPPKVFTRIHLHFAVTGKHLRPEVVARAIKLSAEQLCSASIMLGKTATVTHDFEVINVD